MFGKFTERARRVIAMAESEAKKLNHNYVGTEHILLGLVKEKKGIAGKVLSEQANLKEGQIIDVIKSIIGTGKNKVDGTIGLTPRSKKVLNLSMEEARKLNHNYIGTEHILLGLISEGEGVAVRILKEVGVDLNKVKKEILEILSDGTQNNTETEKVIHLN